MKNERGGFLSTIFVIPIGLALMAGIFFLGYYVGKYKSKTGPNEIVLPLPEVVSENLPKKEEFTFFKTLTEPGNKTVSIELKPRQQEEPAPQKKEPIEPKKENHQKIDPQKAEPQRTEKKQQPKAEKSEKVEKAEKNTTLARPAEQKLQSARTEPVITRSANTKARYTLQIASYQEKDMAEADVRKLKQQGFAAFVVTSVLEGKGTWYRVRVGSFSNRAAAEKLQKEMRAKEGITPFVTLE